MMKFGHIPAIAILSALTLATPAVASAQHETERVDRTVSIRAGGQLRLKNFSGRVTITGSNRGDMVVHAVRRATRDRLEHIRLEITETGSGVSIEANKKDSDWSERNNNVVDTEFEIQLPADVALDVAVFSSDVFVKDVRGRQRIHTFSGDIDIAGAEAAIDAETFSGDIGVKMVQGASASVDFDSFSGELKSDVTMSFRSSSGRRFGGASRVRADIGAGGTDYHFKTFSGDVRIR
jgi:putative adhesin